MTNTLLLAANWLVGLYSVYTQHWTLAAICAAGFLLCALDNAVEELKKGSR